MIKRDLAACYRLVAKRGWDDLIFTHISHRTDDGFLSAPFGILFNEVRQDLLVDGKEMSQFGYNIHSAIYAARPDVNAIIHTHTVAGMAVAAQTPGLLPISQPSLVVIPDLAYLDYHGPIVSEVQERHLTRYLGNHRYMIMRNHGLLTVGADMADAYMAMHLLETACEVQIAAGEARLNPVRWQYLKVTDFKKFTNSDLAWEASLRSV